MEKIYTAIFIRKSDKKMLKRYSSKPLNKYFWKKELEAAIARLLNLYDDLRRDDIIVKEYEGADYKY